MTPRRGSREGGGGREGGGARVSGIFFKSFSNLLHQSVRDDTVVPTRLLSSPKIFTMLMLYACMLMLMLMPCHAFLLHAMHMHAFFQQG